ncbi:MAG: glycosyltransferase [Xenococcaceae cyanobacterium MO_188.B19]|nr:glycosyltransferase [Xenococcaceae cyanobacterium MO_188.B19]
MSKVGVVAIGRNEGDRLIRCLKSLIKEIPENSPIVYVDSGSTDGSVEAAKNFNVRVVELDTSVSFTMAKGRNAGFNYLRQKFPDLEYVQFIDGDCELISGWIEKATQTLEKDLKTAIVCGRRKERFPEVSIYNRLIDMEWNTPIGEAKACGGDTLMRVKAIQEVAGYNGSMICGEEPEMCIRLRRKGWKIQRIDVDMTLHDAAMTKFAQWWKRSIRGGWAVAEGAAMYGSSPEKYKVKENMSGWLWGLILPLLAVVFIWWTFGSSLLLLLGYPVLIWRIYSYRRSLGDSTDDARVYASFCVLSKFPQVIGQSKYQITKWFGQQVKLIEYKTPN